MINLLLINNFSLISSDIKKKATNYCIRFGHSLWSANQLPFLTRLSRFYQLHTRTCKIYIYFIRTHYRMYSYNIHARKSMFKLKKIYIYRLFIATLGGPKEETHDQYLCF